MRSWIHFIMEHRPRKRFGQNFLQNPHVIQKMIHAFHPQPEDTVIEIGPGLGALTLPLLQSLKSLNVIEIDTDLQKHWQQHPAAQGKLNLIAADALNVDYGALGSKLRIIGNLPYNISTPLLLHLLNYTSQIQDLLFMLQKEVVERLAAIPGSKDYGRLTVMIQYHCRVEHLFDVPPEAFYPKPKVESAVVRLTPYDTSPYEPVELRCLEHVLKQAFGMRRKTLGNNLKPLMNTDILKSLGVDPALRPEQMSVETYVKLARTLKELGSKVC